MVLHRLTSTEKFQEFKLAEGRKTQQSGCAAELTRVCH